VSGTGSADRASILKYFLVLFVFDIQHSQDHHCKTKLWMLLCCVGKKITGDFPHIWYIIK
jgi:hypothetical protein